MPNKPAAKKALRQTKTRTVKNAKEKNKIKEILKKTVKVMSTTPDKTLELTKDFQQKVDKAVKAGWMKANTAARKKSRLAKALKKALKK
jgi:small subunit ribosomal protein S20